MVIQQFYESTVATEPEGSFLFITGPSSEPLESSLRIFTTFSLALKSPTGEKYNEIQ
jgi:hypothetical protein